jgi:putative addiction module killer protein
MDQVQIEIYQELSGKRPFLNWENGLSREVRAIVTARLSRVRLGNFGDCKSFEGINELRIDYGPGYRIYFGKKGRTVVILLCGGDKSTQKKDIKKAKVFWQDYLQKQRGDKK